eukprot:801025-Pyramimonas_sp.AAC.1
MGGASPLMRGHYHLRHHALPFTPRVKQKTPTSYVTEEPDSPARIRRPERSGCTRGRHSLFTENRA